MSDITVPPAPDTDAADLADEIVDMQPSLYRFARSLTRDPDEAAELAQETTARALATLDHVGACRACRCEVATHGLLTARLREAVAPVPGRRHSPPGRWRQRAGRGLTAAYPFSKSAAVISTYRAPSIIP